MVLKVYGALISPNTKRVLLALEEFEVQCQNSSHGRSHL